MLVAGSATYDTIVNVRTYPICLIGLDQRSCVVIGGGAVAARKVAALLDAGASVTVVAPEATAGLRALAGEGRITWHARPYQDGDVDGAFLVVAATNDPATNSAVSSAARGAGRLVNVVDVPELSNFIMPAVVRRGQVVFAVSTGGGSPALARRLREELEERYGDEYAELAELLAELRPRMRASIGDQPSRAGVAERLLDAGLLELIRSGDREAAMQRAASIVDGYAAEGSGTSNGAR